MTPRLSATLIVVLLGAVGMTGCLREADATSAAASMSLSPCSVPGIDQPTECGTLAVPENRERPGRTIGLKLVVVRATEANARAAVFFMTGGPGTAATASARALTREHATLAATHDFVFMDQRGTGGSHPLPCPRPAAGLEPVFSAQAAALCRKALEPSADLLAYTTAHAVNDVDDVRQTLGYDRINLHGSSYGTRLAWAYAARFPARARTLVLHGPAPPGFGIPLPFARGLETALDGLLTDCRADAACAERFPRLRADVDAAFERLQAGPVRVQLDETGHSLFTRGELAEAVRYMLYSAMDARRLPLMLTQAAGGDYTPIALASATYRRGLQRILNMGLYLSVTCAEDIPFLDEAAVTATSRGTRLGDYRARQQIEACSAWPRGDAPAPEATTLAVPALIQIGAYDPATPLEAAKRAAALLPNGRLVVVPHGAHAFAGLDVEDCLARITTAFISAGSAATVDDSCVAHARRPPFVLK